MVAMTDGSHWYALVADGLGSTTLALKGNGTVQAVQLFAPFGAVRYTDGTIPTPRNYTGQQLDTTTGLLYYNARYYDPLAGNFISADTVQQNAQGMNPYVYVTGNPETLTDPTGHDAVSWIAVGVGALATVGAVALGAAAVFGVLAVSPILLGVVLGVAAAFVYDTISYAIATHGTGGNENDFNNYGHNLAVDEALGALTGLAAGVGSWLGGEIFKASVGAGSKFAMTEVEAMATKGYTSATLAGGTVGGGVVGIPAAIAKQINGTQSQQESNKQNSNPAKPQPKSTVQPSTVDSYSHIYTSTWINIQYTAWSSGAQTISFNQWQARANVTYMHLYDAYTRGEW